MADLPYTYESVAEEIQLFIDRHPRGTLTRLAAAANVSTQNFRHNMEQSGRDEAVGNLGQRFNIEQIAAIAAEAGAIEGVSDVGPWPFCTWDDAMAVVAVRKVLSHKR